MRKIKHGKMSGGCSDSCCLKLEGVSVHIQGEDILEDVSFHLHCGEITALIGPNGAGKSTLFRSVLGQLSYQGNITFSPAGGPAIRLADGTVMGGTRPLIGYVPQSPSFDRGDPISVLDFFTAMIFASTLGAAICAIPIPQVIILFIVFGAGKLLAGVLTPAMFADLSACGGILTMAAGFRVSKIKSVPLVDLMPALILVMPFSLLWTTLMG